MRNNRPAIVPCRLPGYGAPPPLVGTVEEDCGHELWFDDLRGPGAVVRSRLADEYLWAEVPILGSYDPFQAAGPKTRKQSHQPRLARFRD